MFVQISCPIFLFFYAQTKNILSIRTTTDCKWMPLIRNWNSEKKQK